MPTFKVSDVKNSKKFLSLYYTDSTWVPSFFDEALRPNLSEDEIMEVVLKLYDFYEALGDLHRAFRPVQETTSAHRLNNDTTCHEVPERKPKEADLAYLRRVVRLEKSRRRL